MQFLIDILDERLEAIEVDDDDDRERLRLYFGLWRAGVVDPLRDPGVVVIATLDTDGPRRRRRMVANEGREGRGREAPGPAVARLAH